MKRKITLVLMIALVLALVCAPAISSLLPNYKQTLEASVNNYKDMSKSDLIEAMKEEFAEATQNGDSDSLIPIASVFHQRRTEFTADELLVLIEDSTLDTFLRVTCVQVLNDIPGYDGSDPRLSVLVKKDIPDSVKQSLITHFGYKGGITVSDLMSLATDDNEAVAFHAIKRLNQVDSNRAYQLSKNILQNYRSVNEGQLKAAINVFSQLEKNPVVGSTLKSIQSDKNLLFNVTEIVLNGNYKSTTRDNVMFSIADMNTYESMEYLIHHNKVDEIIKTSVVDRNYHTLIKILENEPTIQQIEFVVKCMEICPINEVAASLEKTMISSPELISKNNNITEDKIVDVLEYVENQGRNANHRWDR